MTMNARRGLYLFALAIPVAFLGWLNAAEIADWLTTGMCPAGPMDRAATSCGVLEFTQIVLLGGWAAFIVVPLLAGWTLVATLVFLGSRAWQLRRMT